MANKNQEIKDLKEALDWAEFEFFDEAFDWAKNDEEERLATKNQELFGEWNP